MCGIFGMVARNARVAPEVLERATLSLAHRGPDDSGTVIVRDSTPEPVEIGLGSRRLAILDLSSLGHQPMQDVETGNWIVFNGEIYNFREIQTELESAGCAFRSRSDTEVLLKAYAVWGKECLSRLRGIFVFAIWDARANALFLARDPIGVKPLYYSEQGGHFLFASEIRTLLGTGLVSRKLDAAGLFTFLSFGSVYEPQTAIEGILALQAGHYLTWQSGRIAVRRYWTVPTISENETSNVE